MSSNHSGSGADRIWKQVNPNGPSAYSSRISNEQWEQHRLFITFLHNKESFTRPDILKILKICREFTPSRSQLDKKMSAWQLKVYKKSELQHDQPDTVLTSDNSFPAVPRDDSIHSPAGLVTVPESTTDSRQGLEYPRKTVSAGKEHDLVHSSMFSCPVATTEGNSDNASCVRAPGPPRERYVSQRSCFVRGFNAFGAATISDPPMESMSHLWYSDELQQIKSVAFATQDSKNLDPHDTLSDSGQLLYSCGMFREAHFLFHEAHSHLKAQPNARCMSLDFKTIDCLRAAISSKYCMHCQEEDVSHGIEDQEGLLPWLLAYGDCAVKLFCCTTTWDQIKCVAMSISLPMPSEGVPVHQLDLYQCSTNPDLMAWYWRCLDVVHHHTIFSYHSESGLSTETVLHKWMVTLNQENCPVWEVLRDCYRMMKAYLLDYELRAKGNVGMGFEDLMDAKTLCTSSSVLGCFFTRIYLRTAGSGFVYPLPVSEAQKLEKTVSFKLTVHVLSVIASWIEVLPLTPSYGQSKPLSQADQASNLASIVLGINKLIDLAPSDRAFQFLRVHRDTWYVHPQDRAAMYETRSNKAYIIETARLLAEASTQQKRSVQLTWNDPVLGKRPRPESSSTRSYTSTESTRFRKFAKRVRGRLKGTKSITSIDELSDKMSMMTTDQNFRFSTVTEFSSKHSLRSSLFGAASMEHLDDFPASKRSSLSIGISLLPPLPSLSK